MLFQKIMAGGGHRPNPLYVQNVFATTLYSGSSNTALQINNGINLSTLGGLVWIKCRSNAVNHGLLDTHRGISAHLQTNAINAEAATPQLGSFDTTGFTHSATPTNQNLDINETDRTFVSWSFAKAAKFFDVVTYTGDGTNNRSISHSLGVSPGMIIIKRRSDTSNWGVYHTSLGINKYILLNTTAAAVTATTAGDFVSVSSTDFVLYPANRDSGFTANASGITYVAYLFAHDTAANGIIQCGSFTSDGSGNATVTLGWQPQYVLFKGSSVSTDWYIADSTRGFIAGNGDAFLKPNVSDAESSAYAWGISPSATGFTAETIFGGGSFTVIYMAIRAVS